MTMAESELERFADDARRAEAVRSRTQRSDRATIDELSSTFAGTLLDLLETGEPAVLFTRAGTDRGVVSALGPDVVALAPGADGRRVLLRLDAVEAIRTASTAPNREADAPVDGATLVDLLDACAEERARVVVTTRAGTTVTGQLEGVGIDQASVRLDGDVDRMIVSVPAIDRVVVG